MLKKKNKELLEALRTIHLTQEELNGNIKRAENLMNSLGFIESSMIDQFIDQSLGLKDYVKTYGHVRHESGMFLVDRLYEIVLQDGCYKQKKSAKKLAEKLKTAVMCSEHEVSE